MWTSPVDEENAEALNSGFTAGPKKAYLFLSPRYGWGFGSIKDLSLKSLGLHSSEQRLLDQMLFFLKFQFCYQPAQLQFSTIVKL